MFETTNRSDESTASHHCDDENNHINENGSGAIQSRRIITKNMYDPELQSYYRMGKIVIWTMTRKWFVSLIYNRLFAWLMRGMQLNDTTRFHSETRWIILPQSKRTLRVRIFQPAHHRSRKKEQDQGTRLPAMLYIHGGGTTSQCPEIAMAFYEGFLNRRDCVIVSPDYRLSLDHPYPAGFDDCYETALWMKDHSTELQINNKLILCGHSSGGGMCAGIALKARDTQDFDVAFQIPCYPMIDYRPYIDPANPTSYVQSKPVTGYTFCDVSFCRFVWYHYLKSVLTRNGSNGENQRLHSPVPIYASPALNTNFEGIPPTISYVGELEPFYEDTVAWIKALQDHKIQTRFKVFMGAFHGFDDIAGSTKIGKDGLRFLFETFGEYYDRYCDSGANQNANGEGNKKEN